MWGLGKPAGVTAERLHQKQQWRVTASGQGNCDPDHPPRPIRCKRDYIKLSNTAERHFATIFSTSLYISGYQISAASGIERGFFNNHRRQRSLPSMSDMAL
jgi:hypothetical protein